MNEAAFAHTKLDPSTYSVVLSTSRLMSRAVSNSTGLSLTNYRILSYIVSNEKALRNAVAKDLDLPRNVVSMGLAVLLERSFISYDDEGSQKTLLPTMTGLKCRRLAHEALRSTIAGDLPILHSSERRTLEHYMVMMTDRLGAPIMTQSEIDVVHLLVETNSRIKQLLKRSVADHGLSPNGFLVLSGLMTSKNIGEATPSQLAQRTQLNKPDITRACHELEEGGCITIAYSPADKRSKIASCTPKGKDAFESACRSFWDAFSTKVRALSADEFAFFTDINTRSR